MTEMEEWVMKRSTMLLCFILLMVGSSAYALAEGIVSDSTRLIRLSKHSYEKVYCLSDSLLLIQSSCSPTTLNKGYIKGRRFEGYIFSKESLITPIHFEDSKERYSPTKEDIIQAEEVIKNELKNTNDLMNQSGECPIIHTHLGKYKRQYIGYINTVGDKVIWVNLIWKKGMQRLLDKKVIIIFDGCSHYWNIKVNLTKKKLSDLYVNGSA